MTSLTFILSELFLIVGFMLGWVFSERFQDYMNKSRHHFEELFEQNPHPELFDEDGELIPFPQPGAGFECATTSPLPSPAESVDCNLTPCPGIEYRY